MGTFEMKSSVFLLSAIAAVPTKTNSVAVDVKGKLGLKSTRSNESNGGSPGTGGGGDNNNGGGGCIGDGCYPPTPTSSTTSTTTTTRKTQPPSNNIERTMANELEWCGYLGLSDGACARRLSDNVEYYNGGYYTCAVTSTTPAAAWSSYYAYSEYYDIFGICGSWNNVYPNKSKLELACQNASNYCGASMTCIRDYV